MPLSATEVELRALLDKIHNYVAFALDGQLTRLHPDTAGRPWRIEIESQAGLPDAETVRGWNAFVPMAAISG